MRWSRLVTGLKWPGLFPYYCLITMIISFCYHQSLLTVFSQLPFILIDISSSQESIGLSDVAIEVLHLLLNYLNSCSKKDLDIKPEEEVAFLDSLRRGKDSKGTCPKFLYVCNSPKLTRLRSLCPKAFNNIFFVFLRYSKGLKIKNQ